MKGPPINYLVTLAASKMQVTRGYGKNPDYSVPKKMHLSPAMWAQLEGLAGAINSRGLVQVLPMDVGSLILELALEGVAQPDVTKPAP